MSGSERRASGRTRGLPATPPPCSRPAGRAAALGALTAAAVLPAVAPAPPTLLARVADAGQAGDPTAPLVALVTLLAWGCAAQLLLIALLTLGARLPGPVGRGLDAVARRVAPVALRRLVAVALGVGVVVGGGGPAAALPLHHAPGAAASASPSPPVPSLDHPLTPAAPRPEPRRPEERPARREAVVVRPGDCLWRLAEAHLGPHATDADVARAWPTWWTANRAVIGDDPDLIRPGTRLVPPPAR